MLPIDDQRSVELQSLYNLSSMWFIWDERNSYLIFYLDLWWCCCSYYNSECDTIKSCEVCQKMITRLNNDQQVQMIYLTKKEDIVQPAFTELNQLVCLKNVNKQIWFTKEKKRFYATSIHPIHYTCSYESDEYPRMFDLRKKEDFIRRECIQLIQLASLTLINCRRCSI